MLKKCFLVAALLACFSSFALGGKLFFTLAPNVADEFVRIMPFRPPHIPNAIRCVRNQPVMLHLVLAKPAIGKDGKVLVEIESIRSIEADGKVKELVKPGRPLVALRGVKKKKSDFSGVMLSGLSLSVVGEDGDPLGKMRIVVKVRDRGDDSTREFTAEIELVDKLPGEASKPMNIKDLNRFFTGYYRAPDPAKIPAAFAAFLRFDEECVGKKSYDPLMWLCGFSELYKLNPQLRPGLAKNAAQYSAVHRQYVALILAEAEASETELKDADPELRRMFAEVREKSPLAFDRITTPAQLDALWMKFFVTGRHEPIRRLVNELRKREGAMTVGEAKKLGRKPTEEEMKKIMDGIIGGAAQWSLNSNAKQHKLVGYYLEAMMLRKQYPDLAAAVKLGRILINAGLMELFDKPDGGKGLRSVLKPSKRKPVPDKGGKYTQSGNETKPNR